MQYEGNVDDAKELSIRVIPALMCNYRQRSFWMSTQTAIFTISDTQVSIHLQIWLIMCPDIAILKALANKLV